MPNPEGITESIYEAALKQAGAEKGEPSLEIMAEFIENELELTMPDPRARISKDLLLSTLRAMHKRSGIELICNTRAAISALRSRIVRTRTDVHSLSDLFPNGVPKIGKSE